jgi:predicted transcriptional regulator
MAVLTETLALRVPIAIKEKIEKLAKLSHRKKSDILLGWIDEKLELESWQIEETHKAIALADSGEMATEEEKQQIKTKWKVC